MSNDQRIAERLQPGSTDSRPAHADHANPIPGPGQSTRDQQPEQFGLYDTNDWETAYRDLDARVPHLLIQLQDDLERSRWREAVWVSIIVHLVLIMVLWNFKLIEKYMPFRTVLVVPVNPTKDKDVTFLDAAAGRAETDAEAQDQRPLRQRPHRDDAPSRTGPQGVAEDSDAASGRSGDGRSARTAALCGSSGHGAGPAAGSANPAGAAIGPAS